MTILEEQYRDSSKLAARMAIHRKYGPAPDRSALVRRIGLVAGERVLEVGCGPGRFWVDARGVAPEALDLVLTDLSPGMVAEAAARVDALGGRRSVRAAVADVCALPFAEGAFDVVLAMHMLYHAADPRLGARELARVLRPGGRAVITTNGAANLEALMRLGRRAFGDGGMGLGAAAFTLDNGHAMLAEVFAEVILERAVDTLRITDPADVVAYLTSFPPGDRADALALQRLRGMVGEAFEQGGGALCVERDTGVLIAVKAAR